MHNTAIVFVLLLLAGCAAPDADPATSSDPAPAAPSAAVTTTQATPVPSWCEGKTANALGDGCFCRQPEAGRPFCQESWNCGDCPDDAREAEAICATGANLTMDPADLADGYVTLLVCAPPGDFVGMTSGPHMAPGRLDLTVDSSWSDARFGQTEHHWVRIHLVDRLPPGAYHAAVRVTSSCDECAPQHTDHGVLKLEFEVPAR